MRREKVERWVNRFMNGRHGADQYGLFLSVGSVVLLCLSFFFGLLGGGQSRKIRAYNQEMMLVEVIFESGAVGSDHSHEHTQISYVLSGEFTYHIEGETRRMLPGDSIVVDGGKVHGCACVKAGTLLDVFAPMREDFVR